MNSAGAIKVGIDMADFVTQTYLADMSDADLMMRPQAECQHINWQIGHLILSENQMMNQVFPGTMPALPMGFAEKYARDAGKSNEGSDYLSKEMLLKTFQEQRAKTLETLATQSDAELDQETGISYAPSRASLFSIVGSHWLMHCGQWVVVRRILKKPVVI